MAGAASAAIRAAAGLARGACGDRRAQLEHVALGRHLDRSRGAAQLGPALAGHCVEAIEDVVGVTRVVVEEQQPAGAHPVAEGERVAE